MDSEIVIIYTADLDGPQNVVTTWVPVQAVRMHGDCYRVLESSNDSEHDRREFENGDIVRCESYTFYENEIGLVARSRCQCKA